ncbi:MAG: DinB family protein [Acidobacteria bacterium]|nr:DinB family protein [Acidobacteriota bacterium]
MKQVIDSMLNELREEASTTKRVLDRVPEHKLGWQPHAKSMSLGQLALHVASIPGNLTKLVQLDEFDASQANFQPPAPGNLKEIRSALEESVRTAETYLAGMTERDATANWRLTLRGNEVFGKPRSAVLRSILFNHWYHHRGQLSVYLRLLEIPVPVIYGRSADEDPFA